ncbi:MAG: TolC family protein, partial [Bdellovibrionales bacterium]
MSNCTRLIILSLFVSLSQNVVAADPCGIIASTQDLFNCALEKDPEYKSSELTRKSARASRDALTKLPNPEMGLKSITGKNAGEEVGGTEVSLSLSLSELLVKRAALSKSGRAEERAMLIEADELEFQSKTKILRDIYRYRQIIDELALVDEALGTYQKIEQQFRSRRVRGPEQEITLSLVDLAQGDYRLKRNHLAVELGEIDSRFKGMLGQKFILKPEWLPKLKQTWPAIHAVQISKNTFELQKLEAEAAKSEAQKSLANAEAWPNISAGPVYQRDTEGPTQYSSMGFNVTVDIPILNWNGGARNLATQNLERAKFNYEFGTRKAELERDLLLRKYTSAVESLNASVGQESLKSKHAKIDGYFRQGLASGTTVIEAHRQMSEFTESQHE